ncbi:MAG: transposase [Opitutales bacterium]|nr:transposase [Opitutales bacterium]
MTSYNYIAIAVQTDKVFRNYNYTKRGLDDLIAFITEISQPLVVIEATAGYERLLIEQLEKAGVHHALITPQRIRAFAKSDGIKAKTDPLDAAVILRFETKTPRAPVSPSSTLG